MNPPVSQRQPTEVKAPGVKRITKCSAVVPEIPERRAILVSELRNGCSFIIILYKIEKCSFKLVIQVGKNESVISNTIPRVVVIRIKRSLTI